MPKCGFFKTAPGRFWKGGFRGRLLVFLKSETDRGRLYVFGYMVPVKMMSHVKKKEGLPHTLLPPQFFEYTLGVENRVELFRFDQIRNGGLKHSRALLRVFTLDRVAVLFGREELGVQTQFSVHNHSIHHLHTLHTHP